MAQGNKHSEHEVKAAFVYHFTKFVEWPRAADTSADSVFRISVLGSSVIADALREISETKHIRGCKVSVEEISSIDDLKRCHVLFVAETAEVDLPIVTGADDDKAVLTIGDWADFPRRGGMIGLYTQKNRMRFRICPDRAREVGLTISSQLLKLADIVCEEG